MSEAHPTSDSMNAGGAKLEELLLQSTLTARVAKRSGASPETVERVITAFLDELLLSARSGGWSPALYRRLHFRPTTSGRIGIVHDNTDADGPDVSASLYVSKG
jgi:hypothetical protein